MYVLYFLHSFVTAQKYRQIFPFPYFNCVQSKVFNDVSTLTGLFKFVICEIVQTLPIQSNFHVTNFKGTSQNVRYRRSPLNEMKVYLSYEKEESSILENEDLSIL